MVKIGASAPILLFSLSSDTLLNVSNRIVNISFPENGCISGNGLGGDICCLR